MEWTLKKIVSSLGIFYEKIKIKILKTIKRVCENIGEKAIRGEYAIRNNLILQRCYKYITLLVTFFDQRGQRLVGTKKTIGFNCTLALLLIFKIKCKR